jgi:hypothetical protein
MHVNDSSVGNAMVSQTRLRYVDANARKNASSDRLKTHLTLTYQSRAGTGHDSFSGTAGKIKNF